MIPISLEQVASAIGSSLAPTGGRPIVKRVVTDSREARPGDLFFAIRGQRLDGHRFVEQAASNGAAACVGDAQWAKETNPARSAPVLIVQDTVTALGRLSAYYRRAILSPHTVVIAVTGSNGKTTTKHMVDHVLRGALPGRCSPKSFNNQIGVPLTLFSAEPDDRYLVVEIGTNAPGEVASLAELVSPNVAVITSIGEAHLAGLGDIEAITREKASLLNHLRPGGLAAVNVDRSELTAILPGNLNGRLVTFGGGERANLRVTRLNGGVRKTTFVLDGQHTVELGLPGLHHATNAAAAFVVARWMGCTPREIVERLRTFTAVEGRSQLLQFNGVTLVDDSYNANPASMAAAIDSLAAVRSGRRVFVLGDMWELGDQGAAFHQQLVRRAFDAGIEVLLAVGPEAMNAARPYMESGERTRVLLNNDADAASDALLAVLSPGDTVWVKGSRGMRLDRVVDRLRTAVNAEAAAV